MPDAFNVRFATAADLEVISHHRARMFADMGKLPIEIVDSFRAQSLEALRGMFAEGKYFGWVVTPRDEGEKIVAGAGLQVRELPPRPQSNRKGKIDIVSGRQAVVVNVYTEPEWRRRGLAALLIKRAIEWTREQGIESVVLHASDDGRTVYERLGFIATNEMRLLR